MVKRTARGGFKHLRDNDLLNLGGTVLLAMDGNANFPTPDPTLVAVQATYDDYKAKLEAASRKGGPLEKSLKNDAREVLLAQLKRLAHYVSGVADGSLSVILSSGFPPSGTPVRQLPPMTPERVRLADYRQSGQLQLGFDAVPGAWLYEYAYSSDKLPDGTIVWPDALVARSSRGNVIAPVTPGVTYYARVRARNGAGVSDWSEPVSLIAR